MGGDGGSDLRRMLRKSAIDSFCLDLRTAAAESKSKNFRGSTKDWLLALLEE
ncbi:MAG: hypothetical protein LBB18_03325 [Puniceicoccales bacterium]|jgi:hypothetical protein|nr:hypothetical protein [Puniceicoccales bacterium]